MESYVVTRWTAKGGRTSAVEPLGYSNAQERLHACTCIAPKVAHAPCDDFVAFRAVDTLSVSTTGCYCLLEDEGQRFLMQLAFILLLQALFSFSVRLMARWIPPCSPWLLWATWTNFSPVVGNTCGSIGVRALIVYIIQLPLIMLRPLRATCDTLCAVRMYIVHNTIDSAFNGCRYYLVFCSPFSTSLHDVCR